MFKNIISLFLVQGGNYIIPLLTLPFLVKTLGAESYGYLGISLAVVQYICLITDYGFNLTATNELTRVSDNINAVSKLFWSVFFCKILLLIVCLISIVVISCFNNLISESIRIIFYSLGIAVGSVVCPVWLFQGKEKMTIIALINILARAITLPFIFLCVYGPDDVYLVAGIMSLSSLIGGGIGLVLIYKYKWVIYTRLNKHEIIEQFVHGWHVFISTASVSLYTTCIPIILGFICGPVAVGYYVAADKIKQAVQGLITPISQVVYPRIAYLLKENRTNGIIFIRKLFIIQSSFMFILSLCLFYFSGDIVLFIYGSGYGATVLVLKILAPCLFLIAISNVLGIQTMLTMGMKKEFSSILMYCGILNIILIFPLSYFLQEAGSALSILLTESIVVFIMLFVVIHRGKLKLSE